MSLINGYIQIHLLIDNYDKNVQHFIYIKKHESKTINGNESELAANRTLYIVNLPSKVSITSLKSTFESIGDIQTIKLGQKYHQFVGNSAYVVFKDANSVEKALNIKRLQYVDDESTKLLGFEGIKQQFLSRKIDLNVMKEEIDKYMQEFDSREEEFLMERERLKNQVDDDGFQMVVNTKKSRSQLQEPPVTTKKSTSDKELQNFYRFQFRENKKKKLLELRKQFEQDKEKIDRMRKSKKFKLEE